MESLAENRRARFDYDILETIEAGIELKGYEVKSVKKGQMNLSGAHAIIRGGEIYLINSQIPPYQPKNTPEGYDPGRTRKLLLKKEEIGSLLGKLQEKSFSLIPLRAISKRGLIKVELGFGRSRKKQDKREYLKKRSAEREMRRGE